MLELLQFVDLTSLELSDNEETAQKLVAKANSVKEQTGFSIASICVYPHLIQSVKKYSQDFAIACVAGGFPSGQMPLDQKIKEVEFAVAEGATEIDFVLSRNYILEDKLRDALLEISLAKKASGLNLLKLILETGELKTTEEIEKASACAIIGGADFIKTSTGKTSIGATPEAVDIMLQVIKNHYKKSGDRIGIKVSGGITTKEIALGYLNQVEKKLGIAWITPKLFRIGASRLVDNILAK